MCTQPAAAPSLTDSHVHLDRYTPSALTRMLARARRAGVHHLLTVGVDLESSRAAVALTRRRGVRAAVGIHPLRSAGLDLPAAIADLRALAEHPGVAAIGEVGLDASGPAALAEQETVLRAQLELARALDLPVVLHVVDAHAAAQRVLAAYPDRRVVIHYFQGDADLAARYLALGCFLSFGKPVTRSGRTALREAARRAPLDRLLIETDTYPLPGRATEPRDVALVCQALAELRGMAPSEIAAATTANYRALFGARSSDRVPFRSPRSQHVQH